MKKLSSALDEPPMCTLTYTMSTETAMTNKKGNTNPLKSQLLFPPRSLS